MEQELVERYGVSITAATNSIDAAVKTLRIKGKPTKAQEEAILVLASEFFAKQQSKRTPDEEQNLSMSQVLVDRFRISMEEANINVGAAIKTLGIRGAISD